MRLTKSTYVQIIAIPFAFLAVFALLRVSQTQLSWRTQAAGGRDFAAFYDLTNPTDLGDHVRLTFSARLFNYSDSDVTSATVTLHGATPGGGPYATFYAVSMPDRQSVRLSQDITVSKQVFERWRQGRDLLLMVQYQDLSGTMRSRSVEISHGPVGGQ